jgi:Phospholipase_D-nuclease N-terminal
MITRRSVMAMLHAMPMLLADSMDAGDVVVVVIGTILGLLQIILWIVAAISILRGDRYTGGGKFLWFIVIIAFPFLGCIGWFVFGRSAQLVKQGVSGTAAT